MNKPESRHEPKLPREGSVYSLLGKYKPQIFLLVLFAILANALNLALPQITSHAIDSFTHGTFSLHRTVIEFSIAGLFIFIFTYGQALMQTYTSERVARDIRNQTAARISLQSYSYIQDETPSKLLTNLTSDADAIKSFVAQAVVSLASSAFIIVGASILLFITNWKLALAIILIIPIIAITFFTIISKVRVLFRRGQEAIDWLNRVINESILGSSLIRVVNSQSLEYDKFVAANSNARGISLSIVRLFATLIPIISFISNIAILVILVLGGHLVITHQMTLGNFTAFNSYLAILIFPILVIGFMSNVIAQASASYARIYHVISSPEHRLGGTVEHDMEGSLSVQHVFLKLGGKDILKDVSFSVPVGGSMAIVGPTAAGKTQLLYILAGLLQQTSGIVDYDGISLDEYDHASLHRQIGLVFQDSIIFNMSVRENIAFSSGITNEALALAIATAELDDFVHALPNGLETVVSERGTSLSGGQKQRIMLARALSMNPKVLLLDDFTARVDTVTEGRILKNVAKNYPKMTIVSVTQKIASAERFAQTALLMEGEVLGVGTHDELLKTSPEYVQIFESQKSTNRYELRAE
jgi:ATP-binding cassette subfamily B protein